MMRDRNLETVRSLYEAFACGDVVTILRRVRPGAVWEVVGGRPDVVPWHRTVADFVDVPRLLLCLARSISIERFEPCDFHAVGDDVLVPARLSYVVRASGHRVEMDVVHWWSLVEGRVTRVRGFEDTEKVLVALKASAA